MSKQVSAQEATVGAAGLPLAGLLDTDLAGHVAVSDDVVALREAVSASKATALDEIMPEVFIPIQEWEGYVVEIGSTDFVARLLDVTSGDKSENEEAVIPLDQLSPEDAADIELGRMFRLVVGRKVAAIGEKTTEARVVFRDLPRITEEDLEEGRKWADEVLRAFET